MDDHRTSALPPRLVRHVGNLLAVGTLGTICALAATVSISKPSAATGSLALPQDESRVWHVSTVEDLFAAAGKVSPTGGTIYLDPGSYVIDRTIEIRSKNFVNFVGTGWDTKITRRGNGDALQLIGSSFCTVRNILLQGDESATFGSAICYRGNSSSSTVEFCRIVNFAESGVRYEGDPKHPMSSNSVRNCHFIGNLGDQLSSLHNNDFYVVGNQFGTHRTFPRSGCVLDHSSAGTYSMNYHWGNQVALRMGPGANFNRVENNRFEERTLSSIGTNTVCRSAAIVITGLSKTISSGTTRVKPSSTTR